MGGWYTITTRVIKLSKYICRGPHERERGAEGPGDLGECRRGSRSPARRAMRLLWGKQVRKRGEILRTCADCLPASQS